MDKEQLQQKIAEYFEKLPAELQSVFSSLSWMETIKEIGVKYTLNENQIELLGTETTLVLLGIIHVEDYQQIVESGLKLEESTTQNIIKDVDEKILKNIKEQLVNTYSVNALSLADEKYGEGKKLDERFYGLPKNVQQAISESDYQVTLYTLAEKYKLSIEQMGILEEVTTKVMLGTINPDKYESDLASKIEIPREEISGLVKEINEKVLGAIRESLKGHWKKNEQDRMSSEDVPLPPYSNIKINNKTETIHGEVPSPISDFSKGFIVNMKKKEEAAIESAIPTPQATNTVVEDIPLPPKTENENPPRNIFEDKLKGITVSDHSVSTHTTPKMVSPSPSNPHDPYREII